MALEFILNDTNVVDFGSGASLDNLGVGTIIVVRNPDTLGNDKGLVCKRQNTSPFPGWSFIINANELSFDLDRTSTDLLTRGGGADIAAGEWQVFAVRWDVNGAAGAQQLFTARLGAKLTEVSSYTSQTAGSGSQRNDGSVSLGVGNQRVPGQTFGAFDGRIARVWIYDRYLDADEMNAVVYRGHVGNGCVLHSRLGQHGIGTQYDLSGNANHGTVTGATWAADPPLGAPAGFDFVWMFALLSGAATQTISPTAIASAEAFGSGKVNQQLRPTAIAGAEAFGAAKLNHAHAINLTGIGSAEAFGTAKINRTVLLAGIASGEAFGSPVVSIVQTIQPVGIASAQAFGTPTIQRGAVTVQPPAIGSAEAFGSAKINRTITALGIVSGEAFGSAQINLRIGGAGNIASAEAFGSYIVQRGAVTVRPAGLASAEAFGAVTVIVVSGTGRITLTAKPRSHAFTVEARPSLSAKKHIRTFIGREQ